MSRFAVIGSSLLLASCQGEHPSVLSQKAFAEAQQNVGRCAQDVRWTYPERSEHCVLAAEALLHLSRDECSGSDSYECIERNLAHSDLALGYQIAISGSLFERGKSTEMSDVVSGVPGLVYRDPDLMRRSFERCIRDEQRDLEAAGLIRVTSMVERPLEKGQRCFRKGYPEFNTRKAVAS